MSVYAISDLHGHYEIYEKVKQLLKPEDKVYCLGDCGDRGPRNFETIAAVYQDPQWTYIKGNHEDMLVKALLEAKEASLYTPCLMSLLNNGGNKTFDEFTSLSNEEQDMWITRLSNLPRQLTYVNENGRIIHLTHAGYTPPIENNPDLLWDRTHFYDPWPDKFHTHIIVHGHTPVQYLATRLNNLLGTNFADNDPHGAVKYCNNHKIDIDGGIYRYGYAILLNLDTFEQIIIHVEEE